MILNSWKGSYLKLLIAFIALVPFKICGYILGTINPLTFGKYLKISGLIRFVVNLEKMNLKKYTNYKRLKKSLSYFCIKVENSKKLLHPEGIRIPSLVIVPPLTPSISVLTLYVAVFATSSGWG